MKNKITLQTAGKYLLFVGLIALLYRKGNFYNSLFPKPFEAILMVVLIITTMYLIKFRKIKDFFLTIPKHIFTTLLILVISILFGWFTAGLNGQSTTLNMILEFGTFGISLVAFMFIIFYSAEDKKISNLYFYALSTPVVYIFFVFFPGFAHGIFMANDNNFLGLTSNVNTISKILLVPSMFFIARTLMEDKKKWVKLLYLIISSALVTLLFWISSRGAILSLILGVIFIWLIFLVRDFSWRRFVVSAITLLLILLIGFGLTPYSRKQIALNRFLNPDSSQTSSAKLKGQSIVSIIQSSVVKDTNTLVLNTQTSVKSNVPAPAIDTRLEIWPFYLKYSLKHLFGIGPNTHMPSYIINRDGDYVSTGPHNTYLQVLLWGGIVGLFSFLFLIFKAFSNLSIKIKREFSYNVLALAGSLFALCLSIMFDDSLSFFWFWIILALSLVP